MKRKCDRICRGFISTVLLTGMVCTWGPAPLAYAAEDVSVYIDGQYVRAQVAPYIASDGYIMLPMRAVYEGLGAAVRYDSQSRQIAVFKDGNAISLTIGKKTAYVNGTPVSLSVAPQLKDGRTMVGLRDGANLLDAEVTWDSAAKKAYVWTDSGRYLGDNEMYSFDDIKEGEWAESKNQRIGLSISKTDRNAAEVQLHWGGGPSSEDGIEFDREFHNFTAERWILNCRWNADKGVLEYKDGQHWASFISMNDGFSHSYLLEEDCAGYFYLESGSLYWVDEKENSSTNCRFVWEG